MKSNEVTLDDYVRWYEFWGYDGPLVDGDYIPKAMRTNWVAGLQWVKASASAMTADERKSPSGIAPARITAIAGATGSNAADVRDLISHFLAFRSDKRETLDASKK